MATDLVKVYIGNVNIEVDEADLKGLFSKHGFTANKINLKQQRGFGFIDLEGDEVVKEACQKLNGQEFHGQILVVEKSDPKSHRRNNLTPMISVTNVPLEHCKEDFNKLLPRINVVDFKQINKNDNTQLVQLTMESTEAATAAFRLLNGYRLDTGGGETDTKPAVLRANYHYPEGAGRGPARSFAQPARRTARLEPPDFPLRVLIPNEMVGAVIGKKGVTISRITKESRAKIDVNRQEAVNISLEKPVTISGSADCQNSALRKIYEVMEAEAQENGKTVVNEVKVLAHDSLVGRLIGKQGINLKKIMSETGTKVGISSQYELSLYNMERTITIKGDKLEGAFLAQSEIVRKLRASYERDMMYAMNAELAWESMYPGVDIGELLPGAVHGIQFPLETPYGAPIQLPMYGGWGVGGRFHGRGVPRKESATIYVPSPAVGALIGRKGQYIRMMKRFSEAELRVESDSVSEESDLRRVCITGTAEAQWKAQYFVHKKICSEGYSGGVEPPFLMVELSVPGSVVGRIIGRRGVVVSEIQRDTSTLIDVATARRSSGDADSVDIRVTGSFFSSQSAQRHIREIVYRFSENQRPIRGY